ncbi:putative phospholipid-transporting ATPase 9 [Solanum pennellii]|uniref:Phospholipid-transporting ATPase n=1 Tax=Solanum pennellii TaxID=28526 RepID=A0ABM1GVL4_SOLPN|nr:putative phospholipid-transporting ATPase 9 [Solanum pennellii]
MRTGRRKKLHFSNFYSFRCGKASVLSDDHSQIGGPGFSRVVFCNEPDSFESGIREYAGNYVSTTKYTAATFLPKSLFEQFRRVANFYFLVTGILAFTPLAPYTALSAILPLVLVIGATMVKEGIEDWRRKQQDVEVNSRKVKVHHGDGVFNLTEWRHLKVGDIVKVEKDQFFPADLLLLSSCFDDAVCYVETMNLDGETNLKLKQALEVTSSLHEDANFKDFKALVKCEDPNANLYTFVGSMEYEEQQNPLSPQQLLLRDSKLRNTEYIYGAVIFTGHDTKVMQNATDPPSKRSKIERKMDRIIYFLFAVLFAIAFVGSVYFGIVTEKDLDDRHNRWYLQPENSDNSVAGTAYGRGITEVEKAMAKRNGSPLMAKSNDHGEDGVVTPRKSTVKGFNFEDERIMNASWLFEPHSDVIQKFFRLLAVCHTVIPEVDEVTGKVSYEAESPDEAAFVIAAREVGFEFFKRTQTNVSVHELDLESGKRIERSYKILNVLEFNSTRKRMSVIVKDEDGKILLLSKGADSIMFERLGKSGRRFEQETRDHVNEYADAGLRTLILAYRELSEEEYKTFNEKFLEAKNSVSEDREAIIDAVTDKIEKDLILLGATAVEDKLQPGVPDCIDKLAQAGIKIWVLTGDKMETAINIGYACSLLRQGMTQIIITLESPEIIAVEKAGEKNAIARASKGSVTQQITEGKALLTASSTEAFALIIDGKSLTYALDDEVKDMFLDLAIKCASVICCRSSPKQKALVTRLVKNGTGKITLAVGDGANDVGMLQEADIGVGISGVEGMQAVMSSDVAIAQFRFLERLLLVHGHWCYRRISTMICYFFYKNIVFGVTLFLYEGYASFSGQPAYNEWFLSTYNVFFTSLPVIALGVFDQDVSARLCLKFPLLYQEGIQNLLFRWRRIIGWMVNGVCSAVIIYFFCITALDPQAFKEDGKVAEFPVVGATMYTCVVWVANCQMALAISYFTLIQHIVIWGGIALWYIFLLIYGNMSSTFSTTAYKIFVEALAPSPFYWIISILTVISALIPYFAYNAIQTRFFPMYHGMIQWIRYEGRSEDPEFCHMVRQRSIRPTTVGFTARSLARRDPFEEKKEHNSSHR